jgi:hypothetical protein
MRPAELGIKNHCASEDQQQLIVSQSVFIESKNCATPQYLEVKYGFESRGTRNEESLFWRGPAAIYLSLRLSVFKGLKKKLVGRHAVLEAIKYARIADMAGRGTHRKSVPMSLITTRFPARIECVAVVPLPTRYRLLVFASGN